MSRDCGAHQPERGCRNGQLAAIGVTSGFRRSLPPPGTLFEEARSSHRNVRYEFSARADAWPLLGTVRVLGHTLQERLARSPVAIMFATAAHPG
jgi:hypothetical protein